MIAQIIRTLAFLGTLSLVACSPSKDDPASRSRSTALGIEAIQDLANDSCRCVRSGGDEHKCWAAFRDQTGHSGEPENVFACAPVSYDTACFETEGSSGCITTRFRLVMSSEDKSDAQLCSEGEAQAVERAYRDTFDRRLSELGDAEEASLEASAAGVEAIDSVLERIRKGESFPADPDFEGCA